MVNEAIRVPADGGEMEIWAGLPDPGRPAPGLVMIHDRDGLAPFARDQVERYAEAGFVTAAPDLYHRCPPDAPREAKRSSLKDAEIAADVGAAFAWLATLPSVASDRIGIVGYCMGGRAAMVGLGSHTAFRAGVIYYGGHIHQALGAGPTPFDRIKNFPCPILGHFGGDDRNPSPEDVDTMEAELLRCGIDHAFHRYPGAGHAFMNHLAPDYYREAAAQSAMSRSLAFLRKRLA